VEPEEAFKSLSGPYWDGRLVFAGEHTSPNAYATMHGAYQTGVGRSGHVT
jgi:monoamine oxidase